MASTWAQFRDNVMRPLLKDVVVNGQTPRWSNSELLTFVNFAIVAISGKLPQIKNATFTADGATQAFTLPADLWEVLAVQDATTGELLAEVEPSPGETLASSLVYYSSQKLAWIKEWPLDTQISFTKPPKNNIRLLYEAYRDPLTVDGSVLPVGRFQWMEQALAYYAAGIAHLGEAIARASLEQWSEKPENQVGNPFLHVSAAFFAHYERMVREYCPPRDVRTYGRVR